MQSAIIVALLSAVAVSACAQSTITPAYSPEQQARDDCSHRFPGGMTAKPVSPYLDCMSSAEVAHKRTVSPQAFADAAQRRAKIMELANEYDAGRMGEPVFRAKMDATYAESYAAAAQAQQQQNAIRAAQSSALMQQGLRTMYPPTVNCDVIRNSSVTSTVNCR